MKLDFSQKYAVRPLTAGDVDKILALCAENEQFYRYHPPLATRESVLEDMTALPPGKCAADKHYLGFFDGETLVAVLDLIERYPQDDTAYIGFFMTKKERQGYGLGSTFIGELMDELRREVPQGAPCGRQGQSAEQSVLGKERLCADGRGIPARRSGVSADGTRTVKLKRKHRCAEGICTAVLFIVSDYFNS